MQPRLRLLIDIPCPGPTLYAVLCSQALGVLTKADGCIGPSLSRLKERLAGRAKDLPALAHGYVSVVNRDSADGRNLSISAAGVEEVRGARSQPVVNRIGCRGPGAGSRTEIARFPTTRTQAAWLGKYLPEQQAQNGGGALVAKLVAMLVGYVRETWAEKALLKLEAERNKRVGQLKALGFEVRANDVARRKALVKLLDPIPGMAQQLSKSKRIWGTWETMIQSRIEGSTASVRLTAADAGLGGYAYSKVVATADWGNMMAATTVEAKEIVRVFTTKQRSSDGKWYNPALASLADEIRGPAVQAVPMCAARFASLHDKVVEAAADYLHSQRPALEDKAAEYLRSFNSDRIAVIARLGNSDINLSLDTQGLPSWTAPDR